MNIPPSTWKAWLAQNTNNAQFDSLAPDKCSTAPKITEFLTENNSLLLLTKPSVGSLLQYSFLHSQFGSSILKQDKTLLAITGLERGSPIEIDTSNLHKTSTVTAPLFTTLLDITDAQPLEGIPTPEDSKPQIRSCTILVPVLREEFAKNPSRSPEELLRQFIKRIREIESYAIDVGYQTLRSETDTEALSQDQQNQVREAVSTTLLESFADNLYFLWSMATNPKLVTPTPCIPLIHPEKLAWYTQIKRYISPPQRHNTPTFQYNEPNAQQHWANAMNRVTAAWEQQLQQQASKETDKKNKEKWRDWEKLAKVQRDTILLAMSNDLVNPNSKLGNALRIQLGYKHLTFNFFSNLFLRQMIRGGQLC